MGARADRVLERMRRVDGDAIAFAHGHILRVLAPAGSRSAGAFGGRLALSAGSVSVLGFERETEVLSRWNEVDEPAVGRAVAGQPGAAAGAPPAVTWPR